MRQIWRESAYIARKDPFGTCIGFVIVTCFVWGAMFMAPDPRGASFLVFAMMNFLLGIHFSRRDEPFLTSLNITSTHLFAWEYGLLSLPLVALLLIANPFDNIAFAASLLILSPSVGLIPKQVFHGKKKLFNRITKRIVDVFRVIFS